MTLTHIANLLPPLTSAISLQSWEDAEDIAREIFRLCKLKAVHEANQQTNAKTPHRGSQVANSPLPVALETRFDESGHAEPWRNNIARELNVLLDLAVMYGPSPNGEAIMSTIRRVAQFEEISTKPS